MNTNVSAADTKTQERYKFADKMWDMTIEANISGIINNDEFTVISKLLAEIDPLVGIK
jgi:hypothetical protein